MNFIPLQPHSDSDKIIIYIFKKIRCTSGTIIPNFNQNNLPINNLHFP